MNQIIKIVVRRPDKVRSGSFKELYRNLLTVDDSLNFDYHALIKGLRLLYPAPDVIIDFSIT